jgi:hypothetical protein
LHNEFGEIDVFGACRASGCPSSYFTRATTQRTRWRRGARSPPTYSGARFVTLESENHIRLAQEPAFERLVNEIDLSLGEDVN